MPVSEPQATELLASLTKLIRTVRCVVQKDHANNMTGTLTGVLRFVADQDVRPGDLASQLMVASSVASRAVAALEADGLVERRPDPADARACRIAITDRGRACLLEREQYGLRRLIDALPDWNDAEVSGAATVLSRLEHSFSAAALRSVAPTPKVLTGTTDLNPSHLEPSPV